MTSQHQDAADETVLQLVASSETLESFREDVQYLWCPDNIPVYEEPPSALDFLRNHVAVSRPCIIRNSIVMKTKRRREDEDACSADGVDTTTTSTTPLRMTLDDLVERFPDTTGNGANDDANGRLPPLCVDVTPDGHGDCLRKVCVDKNEDNVEEEVTEKVFVKPLERDMTISGFRRHLRRGRLKQQLQQEEGDNSNKNNILDRVFQQSSSESDSNPNSDGKVDDDDTDFLDDCVLYYSRQNDCLREELSSLWNAKASSPSDDDNDSFLFPRSFPWAEEAFFGQQTSNDSGSNSGGSSSMGQRGPDAVNLWMGDERAVSAMHKDHYENLFYVLSGEKVFGLCPPSDAPFLYEREVIGGRFNHASKSSDDDDEKQGSRQQWTVDLDREEDADSGEDSDNAKVASEESVNNNNKYSKVHWIATDLFGKDSSRNNGNQNGVGKSEEFPLSRYAHPITVRVREGELLYLPSLWFHRVTQTCETIGINYWYDMNFESPMWCYFHFLQQLRSQQQRPPQSTNGGDS